MALSRPRFEFSRYARVFHEWFFLLLLLLLFVPRRKTREKIARAGTGSAYSFLEVKMAQFFERREVSRYPR